MVGFQRARGCSWFSTLARGLDIALLLPTQDRIDVFLTNRSGYQECIPLITELLQVLYINQLNGQKELENFRDLNVGPAFRTI
ncbi:hypothetical protein H4I95_01223 [Botrytis cinerea]